MAKNEFKTVEEAVEHIKKQNEALKNLASEKAKLQKDLKEAQDIAKDAIETANQTLENANGPKGLTVKLSSGSYEVLFGVDGLTKEELSANKEKCQALADSGSGALQKIGG